MVMGKGGRRNQMKREFLGMAAAYDIHIVGLRKLEGNVCIVAGIDEAMYRHLCGFLQIWQLVSAEH